VDVDATLRSVDVVADADIKFQDPELMDSIAGLQACCYNKTVDKIISNISMKFERFD